MSPVYAEPRLYVAKIHGAWRQRSCEYLPREYSFRRLPQVTLYGIRAPFGRLERFGKLILQGRMIRDARRESALSQWHAFKFIYESGLSNIRAQRIEQRRVEAERQRLCEVLDSHAKRLAQDTFLCDLQRATNAAALERLMGCSCATAEP